jgi:branched-chain amino acid transport system permease protein
MDDQLIQTIIIGLSNGLIYALVALGYTLVYGILQLINFAHGDVFMLGSMIALTLLQFFGVVPGLDLLTTVGLIFVVLLITMAITALLNVSIERIAYRPLRNAPKLAPLISAIGMSFILQNIGLLWKGPANLGYPDVIPNTNILTSVFGLDTAIEFSFKQFFVAIITIPLLIVLMWFVGSTRQGKAMRATAQDQEAAAMMGINVNRTISFTFLIAGALAGVAGLLYALYSTNIQYDQGFTLGLIAFTAAVLGGIGNLPGAVLGAICIGLIQQFNEGLTWNAPGSDWTQSIVFAILILILVFRPEGLLGERTPEGG